MIRGSPAERIFPKSLLFKARTGLFGFKWFGMLNASARNSTDCRSDTRNFRVRPMLSVMNPGPWMFREALPHTPSAGRAKAAGFSQPLTPLLGKYGSGSTWFARSIPKPVPNDVLNPDVGAKYVPD